MTRDDILWKERVVQLFRTKAISAFEESYIHLMPCLLQHYLPLSPGTSSWRDEFRRLTHHVPSSMFHEESIHYGGVSHIAFSNDGSMFASCGEDARYAKI